MRCLFAIVPGKKIVASIIRGARWPDSSNIRKDDKVPCQNATRINADIVEVSIGID